MNLTALPYDLLLNVSQHLGVQDVVALQLTCRSLHELAFTRPIFRHLALNLLARCRPLPLDGFKRISDLSLHELRAAVSRAAHLEHGWTMRAPRPARHHPLQLQDPGPDPGGDALPNDLDAQRRRQWYRVVNTFAGEDIDWLSPITSTYSLCATRGGKMLCWDVTSDRRVAEWAPVIKWDLWKCRVEFDEGSVFFAMARPLNALSDSESDRLMEFLVMKLQFYESTDGVGIQPAPLPTFTSINTFRTMGRVMNVFLLEPKNRVLSAFVWLTNTNTLGLYVMLDWEASDYVYVDTGLSSRNHPNWSCIMRDDSIVIHCEEADWAVQHIYTLNMLAKHACSPSASPRTQAVPIPQLSSQLPPLRSFRRRLCYVPAPLEAVPPHQLADGDTVPLPLLPTEPSVNGHTAPDPVERHLPPSYHVNPFPFPPWYTESAHFVRQWWPTLPGVPRLSCTVLLLAKHDTETHATKYALAQHYFRVPLAGSCRYTSGRDHDPGQSIRSEQTGEEVDMTTEPDSKLELAPPEEVEEEEEEAESMQVWYAHMPYELVCVEDVIDGDDGLEAIGRPRPLLAVDFGHAVWVEYASDNPFAMDEQPANDEAGHDARQSLPAMRLRFVTFPGVDTVSSDGEDCSSSSGAGKGRAPQRGEGVPWTLEKPDELDLRLAETINIDQSQGAVIISIRGGRIFILFYE